MKKCPICEIELKRKVWQGKKRKLYESNKRFAERIYCGSECRSKALSEESKGENNYFYGKHLTPWNKKEKIRWRVKQTNGYVRIVYRREDGSNYFVYEHREVVENSIGRTLRDAETIHHLNGDKSDNSRGNLWLFKDNGEHHRIGHATRDRNRLLSTSTPTVSTQR